MMSVFFFQAEDGIRDLTVTGVQTCALPILYAEMSDRVVANLLYRVKDNDLGILARIGQPYPVEDGLFKVRSEERRVGKERRSRWSPSEEREEGGEESAGKKRASVWS